MSNKRRAISAETRAAMSAAKQGARNPAYRPIAERLAEKVVIDPETGCHVWVGTTSRGYPMIRRSSGPKDYAYRVAYELRFGPIPKGHILHHTCRNPLCTNPAHLLPVPSAADHRAVHRMEDEIVATIRAGEIMEDAPRASDAEAALDSVGALSHDEVLALDA